MELGYYFPDPDYFHDFVRMQAHIRCEQDFILYHVQAFGDYGAGLILCGCRIEAEPPQRLYPLTMLSRQDHQRQISLTVSDGRDGMQARVIRVVHARALADLAVLKPWRGTPAPPYVIFLLFDAALLKTLVTASLRLGNDRIQYAPLQLQAEPDNGQPSSLPAGEIIAVRVEQASYFLIRTMLEEYSGSTQVYHPVTGHLHLPWGLDHPLADLYTTAADDGGLTFICDKRYTTGKVDWRDIYALVNAEFDTAPECHYLNADQEPEKFTIALAFTRRQRPLPPELWLLRQPQQEHLHALLAVLDQQDLDPYSFATVTFEDEPWIWIRERLKRIQSGHLAFPGYGFASYRGFSNLFLPVDRDLQPNVRRDNYQQLFTLQAGENTIAMELNDRMHVVKIDDKAFFPLGDYVDHVIDAASQHLEAAVHQSFFDFELYAKAPMGTPRSTLAGQNGRTPPPPPQSPAEQQVEQKSGESRRQQSPSAGGETLPVEEPDRGLEPELERAVIREQSLQNWRRLIDYKIQAGRHLEVESCAADYIWLDSLPDTSGSNTSPGYQIWRQSLEALQSRGFEDDPVLKLKYQALKPAAEQDHNWVMETSAGLREMENRLRSKELWLLWHQVFAHNRDSREQARVRDLIRGHVIDGKRYLTEIPPFIRNRIFYDRRLHTDDNDDAESLLIVQLINQLQTAVGEYADPYRDVAAAVLARLLTRALELKHRALEFLSATYPHLARLLNLEPGTQPAVNPDAVIEVINQAKSVARPWVALYLHHAFPEFDILANVFRQQLDASDNTIQALLQPLHQHLQEKQAQREPGEFLSRQNLDRLYPDGGEFSRGPAADFMEQINDALGRADKNQLLQLIPQALDATTELSHPVMVAKLVGEIVRGIVSIKWDMATTGISEQFAAVARSPRTDWDLFYKVLRNTNFTAGLLELGFEEQAAELLHQVLDDLPDIHVELDFIDACAAIIRTVECFSLNARGDFIPRLTAHLVTRMKQHVKNPLYTRMQYEYFRLIDQLTEAAISKDKIAIGQLNTYRQQDEFIILGRILSESIP